MNNVLSRRTLLLGTGTTVGLAAVTVLAGCNTVSSNTVNGVTTLTVNVAEVDAYAQAGANFADAILDNPLIASFVAPYSSTIQTAKAVVLTDIAAFDKAAGGSVQLQFTTASVPAAANSVLADLKTLLDDATKALPQTAIIGTIESDVQALQSLIAIFQAELGITSVGAAAVAPMSKTRAFQVLGVKAPVR